MLKTSQNTRHRVIRPPAVPVVPSAVSSAWVSPEPVREVSFSGMLDVFPVYEPSPNTSLYLPATSPVTHALLGGHLQLLGTESVPPGGEGGSGVYG